MPRDVRPLTGLEGRILSSIHPQPAGHLQGFCQQTKLLATENGGIFFHKIVNRNVGLTKELVCNWPCSAAGDSGFLASMRGEDQRGSPAPTG
jgi:hypothetical protein